MLIDAHAHYISEFFDDYEYYVEKAENNEVKIIFNTADSLNSSIEVIELNKKYPMLLPVIGVHPTNMVSTSPVFLQGRNILKKNFANISYEPSKPVSIGNDVWIGEGVCIVSGVTIGDGAVIGAHAVVTHDVEPYTIVAGVPARVIRKRFDDDVIERLEGIKWWDWSEDLIAKYSDYFSDPNKLLNAIDSDKA